MEKGKRIDEMSIDELAKMISEHPEAATEIEIGIDKLAQILIDHPEMFDEIRAMADSLSELYDSVEDKLIPHGDAFDDKEAKNNVKVERALESISDYLHNKLGYESWQEYESDIRADEKFEQFINNLNDDIAYGYPPEELKGFCEREGYDLDKIYNKETLKELYESSGYDCELDSNTGTLRVCLDGKVYLYNTERKDDQQSSLQKRETELASLEAEEKTISETEALIELRTQKEGKDIGEN